MKIDQPFNKNSGCPKCLSLVVSVQWQERNTPDGKEYLLYQCGKCGFSWSTLPADHGYINE